MRNILVFFSLLLFLSTNAQNPWKLKKDKNGVQVFVRNVDSSKIKEYKAVTQINTSVEQALSIILDGNRLADWNYKTSESKTIRKITDDEYIFWMKNDLPWPVKNRDNVTHVKVNKISKDSIRVDLAPDRTNAVPEMDGMIRVTNFKGFWLVSQKGDKVEVIQQLYGDPKGNLPSWILNSVLTTAPYRSFLNLKSLLED